MNRREGRNGFLTFQTVKNRCSSSKETKVHMKNGANGFFVLDKDKPLLNGCWDSNLKLEIGTKEIIRKKRIGNTSITEMSLIFLSAC